MNAQYSIIFLASLMVFSCGGTKSEKENSEELSTSEWTVLFNNENLEGWDTYIGPAYDPSANTFQGEPVGLNKDPNQVFTVVDLDGAKAIRISGKNNGGISTTGEFENYHLQLQFKWGETRYPPRTNQKRDSGVLYHAVGPHGADFGFWMRSQEMQIQEGDCGDYWGVAGGAFDVMATMQEDSSFVYDPNGQLYNFSEISENGRQCIKNPDNENPTGEWNVVDLYCIGGTAVHMINGKVNMILYNSSQIEEGELIPLTKGKIQIQSEGAEVFYRDIKIEKITEFPAALGVKGE